MAVHVHDVEQHNQTTGHGKMNVEQFQKRHDLSDKEFQNLESFIRASYPDQQLTRTERIVDLELFEAYLQSIRSATSNR